MKKTILDLYKMKENEEKAVWITAYDAPFASYAYNAGADILLVGDSMGMVVYGMDSTVPVTMDMCINHCQAVRRGAPEAYILGDMPFGAYHISVEDAVKNAVRFVKEADVDAIKLEGGISVADKIEAITKAGIAVFGHVGLTPQSSAGMERFNTQKQPTVEAKTIIDDAIAVYKAGAHCILLSNVPDQVTKFIHKLLPIPVYGIGSGPDNDGECLVMGDILGMFEKTTPKFAKRYANIREVTTNAYQEFIKEVKDGDFPTEQHKRKILENIEDFEIMFDEIKKDFKE